MKILWITNSVLPELAIALGKKPKPFGGWLLGLKNKLNENGHELIIATVQKGFSDFMHESENTTYYLLQTVTDKTRYDAKLEAKWEKIIQKYKPDIVHIHGSEHSSALPLVNKIPHLNYVLSIQGLISVYARYYRAGIPIKDILKAYTFRSFLKRDSILEEQLRFKRRGQTIEKKYFSKISNFIGRTDWDKAHTFAMNPNASYHFCNEALRDSFYTSVKWNVTDCEKHTIFLSQGNYPIKGLHQVINAVALLKKEFPQIKIKFAGSDILGQRNDFKGKIKLKDYGKYLRKLVEKLDLNSNIEYLGVLNEDDMRNAYLNSHIFVCPSSIENSPNSLAEAQLLGVPSIASYTGGTPNMVMHKDTGYLYRFEEYEQLAQYIRKIFNNDALANKLSQNSINSATKRHDKNEIALKTIAIYKNIIDTKESSE